MPGPALTKAYDYVDSALGEIVAQLKKEGLAGSTALVITSKQGQAPTNPDRARR